jgi:isopenicillin N synthase-like dioxygenase
MVSSYDISVIPLINFEPYLHGSTADRERVAASVDAGLSSTGFIYLRNHGIDQRKIDECFNWVSGFFHT